MGNTASRAFQMKNKPEQAGNARSGISDESIVCGKNQCCHSRFFQPPVLPASNGGVLYLILYIFGGIIAYALIQNELNKLAE
mgnify:CR=1 FL=1